MTKVVFDFDKTLTDKDTLFGFYKQVDGNNSLFFLKRILLLFFAVIYKTSLISNDTLKKVGVLIFLKGKTKEIIEISSIEYAKTISFNAVYRDYFLNYPIAKRLIISASFEDYLLPLLPGEQIMGSKLKFHLGKVIGLQENMYGKTKQIALLRTGYKSIDALYTDSFSDRPLMEVAKSVFLVKNQSVKVIKS
jgi:phosphoserine phosphatase